MRESLLVRLYNVGCGDCILLRIPDADCPRHVLIDCGNYSSESASPLGEAVADIQAVLAESPLDGAPAPLDLVVITHRHMDHIKGFESELGAFRGIGIRRIWLSAAMDPKHPNAEGFRARLQLVREAASSLQRMGLGISPALQALLENNLSFSKADASRALSRTLAQINGIAPLYVYRGVDADLTADDDRLLRFMDPTIRLRILGPERDIDGEYLGREALDELDGMRGIGEVIQGAVSGKRRAGEALPTNVSASDFRRLQARMLYGALGFAESNSALINDTSVVLLLEWRGRRLFFPGDAQWTGGEKGQRSGSWDVMWRKTSVRNLLSQPVDFLKVSHHGSHNATPWDPDEPSKGISRVLNQLLPEPSSGQAPYGRAVVSTREGVIRHTHNPVPHPGIMAELSQRVQVTRLYDPDQGREPRRTDREGQPWIDVELGPA